MKYENVIIDLKPRPVLQELIEDLTHKMLAQQAALSACGEYADNTMVQGWNNPYHNSFKAQLISFKILKINETNNTNILGELMYSNTNHEVEYVVYFEGINISNIILDKRPQLINYGIDI